MATLIHLDTHVLVWLYAARTDLLSRRARRTLEAGDLAASPIAVLELTFLREIGRLTVDGPAVTTSLADQLGLIVDDTPLAVTVAEAHSLRWTRDPFDRLIVANAKAAGATLLTADDTIRRHVRTARW